MPKNGSCTEEPLRRRRRYGVLAPITLETPEWSTQAGIGGELARAVSSGTVVQVAGVLRPGGGVLFKTFTLGCRHYLLVNLAIFQTLAVFTITKLRLK